MSLIALSDRLFDFQSIYNFRDFGGYAAADGARVKTGHLFRSAHLNNLNDSELGTIGDLDIGLIVDLRHAPERKRQPSRLPDTPPLVFEFPDPPETQHDAVAPHEAFMQNDLQTPDDSYQYMMRSYTARPDDAGFQAIFKDTLLHLIDDQDRKGVLVHCAAGKDRTGTLVALIQGLLGVSKDDILHDYMLTMEAVDIDKMLEPAAQMFTQRYGRPIAPEAIRPMFSVAPEYLEASLGKMGDMTDYTKNVLKLSSQDIDLLRQIYLEN
ncbi:tyrosine-protein phosphatase [Litorimonas sp. RW-G-Af-16]|uniref:tyrosine-protein phosphatase n=1 Tax=Litorimonas sp. RW-G-Af-16 TaxID=3241168 RepID=UPI00390C67C4